MKKSKIRLVLTLMIAVCIAITSLAIPISATENVIILDSLPNFDENYIPSSLINYSIDDKIGVNGLEPREDVVEIIVSNENIEIEAALYSEYLDVFGKLENGKYINITDEVVCDFEDESIAMWIFGRIIADKMGTTTAVLNYNGLSKEITVTVNNQIILDDNTLNANAFIGENADINVFIDPNIGERTNILDIAEAMVYMEWTPSQTFAAYNGHTDFQAGITYTGMPYTQFHNQSTYAEFFNAYSSADDFYDSYTNSNNVTMSRYGNDCSGFLSICWGLFRNDTWRNRWNTTDFRNAIENGTYTELDYNYLNPADALYKSGHVMLVKSVSTSSGTVTVYEQTGRAARMSVYTFEELSASSYTGFTKF